MERAGAVDFARLRDRLAYHRVFAMAGHSARLMKSTPTLFALALLTSLHVAAAPRKKSTKKTHAAPAVSAPTTPALAPPPAPVTAPAPMEATPAPVAATPAPAVTAPPPPLEAPPLEVAERPSEPKRLGLLISAEGGVSVPLSVLTSGVRVGARVDYRLIHSGPLLASFGVGYERHTAAASRVFLPPTAGNATGGADPQALENQDLMTLELGVKVEPWRNERNALTAGAFYGLLPTWTQVQTLGETTTEAGLGQQVALDLGYARRFGRLTVSVHGRWSVRRTGVGLRTNVVELPWYQTLGLVVGVGAEL